MLNGPGTGGRLQVGYQQALLKVLHKDKHDAFRSEDPREEILKYAKVAEENPYYVTTAYVDNQPDTVAGKHLAKTVDPDDEPEEEG